MLMTNESKNYKIKLINVSMSERTKAVHIALQRHYAGIFPY